MDTFMEMFVFFTCLSYQHSGKLLVPIRATVKHVRQVLRPTLSRGDHCPLDRTGVSLRGQVPWRAGGSELEDHCASVEASKRLAILVLETGHAKHFALSGWGSRCQFSGDCIIDGAWVSICGHGGSPLLRFVRCSARLS